jgi:hypothetical protein
MKIAYYFTLGVLFLAMEFLGRRTSRSRTHEG